MISSELNPNHPVTQEIRDHWHKIAAILLYKMGRTRIDITSDDVQSLNNVLEGGAICVKEKGDHLEVFLASAEEAQRLAKEEGGLPV